MTDHLETVILSEANRQGIQPNADAMRKAAVDLAGSVMTSDGLISIPGLGSISAGDFVRSLHGQMPESFAAVDSKTSATKSSGNMTADMKAEIAAGRRQRTLPSDWLAVRSKATGTTAQHLAERERNWK